MSNDLIERLRKANGLYAGDNDVISEAAKALEAKDKEIELLEKGYDALLDDRNEAWERVAELEAKGLAVLDSWENGNYDGDLDGNMLELAEALGERDDNC